MNPSPRQRAAALVHVYYEIDQLTQSDWTTARRKVDENALLESCLLHVRALLGFLQAKKRTQVRGAEQDDVIAGDFGFRARRIAGGAALKRKINKRLAHLTYARCRRTRTDQSWQPKRDLTPVLTRSREFIEHLLPRLHKYRGTQNADEWSALLARVKDRIARG